jgi:hypothetical protein
MYVGNFRNSTQSPQSAAANTTTTVNGAGQYEFENGMLFVVLCAALNLPRQCLPQTTRRVLI